MSEIKSIRSTSKKGSFSSKTKLPTTEPSSKMKKSSEIKGKQDKSLSKNLMKQFEKMGRKDKKSKDKNQKIQQHSESHQNEETDFKINNYSEISSKRKFSNQSSNSNTHSLGIHFSTNQNQAQKQNYQFNLPKSYLLGMKGLQQTIENKEKQIHYLKKQIKEKNKTLSICENTINQFEIFSVKQKELLNEKIIEVKLLNQTIQKYKNEKDNLLQQKHCLNKDIEKIKQSEKENDIINQRNHEKQIEKIKNDFQNLIKEIQIRQYEKRDILHEGKDKIEKNLADLHYVVKENQALKQQLKKVEIEAEFYKHQQKQISEDHEEEVKKRSKSSIAIKEIDNVGNLMRSRKMQNGKILKRENYLPLQDVMVEKKDLISQYRDQIRYQKQLISLNYQMEMLEKEMANGRYNGEVSRTYCKIKRQIEKKEAFLRDMRTILKEGSSQFK